MTHRTTKFDRVFTDLAAWNPETRQWSRQYISNHCTRYHLLRLVELADCQTTLATSWPVREELLDALDVLGPDQLLEAWHRLEAEWAYE
jgi:hypothetical protein